MRWFVVAGAVVLLMGPVSASLIESQLATACGQLPTPFDPTDLCTYQFDFDTWGDARDDCIVTEVDKSITVDSFEKDALFVIGDDQVDNLIIHFTGGVGAFEVTFTPALPLQGFAVQLDVTRNCSDVEFSASGPATDPITASYGGNDLPGAIYQIGIQIHSESDLVDAFNELVVAEAPVLTEVLEILDLLTVVGQLQIVDEITGIADLQLLELGSASIATIEALPQSVQVDFVEHRLTTLGIPFESSSDSGKMPTLVDVAIQTQCEPFCAANMVDQAVNPNVGYSLKATRIAST